MHRAVMCVPVGEAVSIKALRDVSKAPGMWCTLLTVSHRLQTHPIPVVRCAWSEPSLRGGGFLIILSCSPSTTCLVLGINDDGYPFVRMCPLHYTS